MDQYDEVERELGRVVDCLNSMPLAKAAQSTDDCYAAAAVLLRETRTLDPAVPDVPLPTLGPQGLGAMIAVLGGDWLTAARAIGTADPEPVLAALVALRRALP